MNVEYRRDLNHNYLIIQSEESFFDYQVRMLACNRISGLLECVQESVNNKISFLYEISSKQPFTQIFQRSRLNFEYFKIIINCFKTVVGNMADYLLDVNSLVLSPEYIYMNPETKEVELIYVPGLWNDIKSDFHELARCFLDWVDYEDEQAVSSVYELYQKTGEDNYTLSEIFDTIFVKCTDNEVKNKINTEDNMDKSLLEEQVIQYKTDNDFVFVEEEEVQEEKTSLIHRFAKPIMEAAGNIFKSIYNKDKDSYADNNTSLDCIIDETTEYEFEDEDAHDEDNVMYYSKYAQSDRSFSYVAEDGAGYGDTVFFQEQDSHKCRLIPIDNKYKTLEPDIFPFIIGKLQEAVDGIINDESVSRIHCKIERQDNRYFIVDLNSTNGTYVNGDCITPNEKTKLQSGDRLQFGFVEYKFEC